MKSKVKTRKPFAVFLDGRSWEEPVYSDDLSHDPKDCYSEEALFGCVDASVFLDREKQNGDDSRG
jgi:hypothetical protein